MKRNLLRFILLAVLVLTLTLALVACGDSTDPKDDPKKEDDPQDGDMDVTISFEANGGEGTMDPITKKIGTDVTLPACTFTKEGYTFSGWATTADGDVAYTDGAQLKAQVIRLYAIWTPATVGNLDVTIFFDANGGEGTMASITEKIGTDVTLPTCTFTKEGYKFAGWSTTAEGDVEYTDGATIGAQVIKLFAVWEEEKCDFTLRLSDDKASYIITGVKEGVTEPTVPATYGGKPVSGVDADGFKANKVIAFKVEGKNFKVVSGALCSADGKTLLVYPGAATATTFKFDSKFTSVGDYAFYGNTTLTEIDLNSVGTIGKSAFENCTNAAIKATGKSVSLLACGMNAFAGTAFYNNAENWTNGILSIAYNTTPKSTLIVKADPAKVTGELTLDKTAIVIADGAFENCTGLATVTLSSQLLTIGNYAFSGCTSLTEVIYGQLQYVVGTSITLTGLNIKTVGNYAFSGCAKLEFFFLPPEIEMLYAHTFDGCSTMKYLVVPARSEGYVYEANWLKDTQVTDVFFIAPDSGIAQYDQFKGAITSSGVKIEERLVDFGQNNTWHLYNATLTAKNSGKHFYWHFDGANLPVFNDDTVSIGLNKPGM